jgi:hypothetical protein
MRSAHEAKSAQLSAGWSATVPTLEHAMRPAGGASFWNGRRTALAASVVAVGVLALGARLRHIRKAAHRAIEAWSAHESEQLGRDVRSLATYEFVKAMAASPLPRLPETARPQTR